MGTIVCGFYTDFPLNKDNKPTLKPNRNTAKMSPLQPLCASPNVSSFTMTQHCDFESLDLPKYGRPSDEIAHT